MPDELSASASTIGTLNKKLQHPIVRAKSPLRISFTGGGTDVPVWYEKYPGAVISSSINRYAYVTMYPRKDREIHIRSLDMEYSVKYHLDEAPAYDGVMDLAKVAIKRLGVERGLDIDVRSDAPAGSGLGGSSALTSALLGALAEFRGVKIGREKLAELNYTVERVDLNISGGKQDQYATAYGGFNCIKFSKDFIAVEPIDVDDAVVNDLEAHMLMCYTGKVRAHANLIDKQVDLLSKGSSTTIDGMKRLYDMVYEMRDSLVEGDLDKFGFLMHESYVNKKRMNPHITDGTPTDSMYEAALHAGALGGKLLGAGGGGYLSIYCPTEKQHEVRNALEAMGALFTDFAFDKQGIQVWRSSSR
ncbi:MAG: GHMP kinase [Pirellulales bacterium]|nr:GHMP kinase [Pirellulales bacterium]